MNDRSNLLSVFLAAVVAAGCSTATDPSSAPGDGATSDGNAPDALDASVDDATKLPADAELPDYGLGDLGPADATCDTPEDAHNSCECPADLPPEGTVACDVLPSVLCYYQTTLADGRARCEEIHCKGGHWGVNGGYMGTCSWVDGGAP